MTMTKPLNRPGEATPSSSADNRKQSLYFPEAMLDEIKTESVRLDRSLSWVVQRAWKTARAEIKKIPSSESVEAPSSPAPTKPSP